MTAHPKKPDLLAYLNAETSPSSKQLIQSHIAECRHCQQEIERLSKVENHLKGFLHTQATYASPGEQVWESLKDKLPNIQKSQKPTQGGLQMKKLVPAALLAAIFLAAGLIFAVPGALAQFEELFSHWIWTESPDGSESVSWGSSDALPFTPYTIEYFPVGFQSKGTTSGFTESFDSLSFSLAYDNGQDRYIKVITSQGAAYTELPKGEPVIVNGQAAVLVKDIKADSVLLGDIDDFVKNSGNEHFLLTWFAGDVQVEILSNFSVAEILQIAESAVPMETGGASAPQQ